MDSIALSSSRSDRPRLRRRLRSMASRSGEADDRGRAGVLTSPVGEVDPAGTKPH
jgi:hypothetical protein